MCTISQTQKGDSSNFLTVPLVQLSIRQLTTAHHLSCLITAVTVQTRPVASGLDGSAAIAPRKIIVPEKVLASFSPPLPWSFNTRDRLKLSYWLQKFSGAPIPDPCCELWSCPLCSGGCTIPVYFFVAGYHPKKKPGYCPGTNWWIWNQISSLHLRGQLHL